MDKDEIQHKISIGGEDFFSLEAAAKRFVFGLRYLSLMVRRGRLKAFKMGDYWYTCEKWINDHKKHIGGLIEREIKDQEHNLGHLRKWVRKTFK
jgi:hypothetical protein